MQFIDTIVHTPVALSFQGTQTSESLGPAPGRHVEFADTLEVVEFKPSLPAEITDHHFEGLCAASRHKSLALSNKQRRQFTHLDIDFNWSRQVTANKREQLITEILGGLIPPLAATHAATATAAPRTEYVAPAPVLADLQEPPLPNIQVVQVPQVQIMEKTVEIPEIQTNQDTRTSECLGAHVRRVNFADTVVEYVQPVQVVEFVAPAPAVSFETPTTMVEYVTPAPAVTNTAPAPVVEYVASAPAVTHVAPASVVGSVAPASAVDYAAPAPVQVEEQFLAVATTLAATDETFPHEKFEEACRLLPRNRLIVRRNLWFNDLSFARQYPEMHVMRASLPRPGKLTNPAR